MNDAEYKKMFDLESYYWWFVARRKLVSSMLFGLVKSPAERTTILDVGCGTGLNVSVFSKFGQVYGADSSLEALALAQSRGVKNVVLTDVEMLDFPDEKFDIVTALDVLEHTDNDQAALREMWRVLKPGGKLVVTVPAYGFLWTEHDEALHHRRRYTAYELRNKMTTVGFDVQRSTYFITLLFFPILLIRLLQNLTKKSVEAKTSYIILPKWVNSLLVRILDLEQIYLRFLNLPFGVSVVAIAKKTECLSTKHQRSETQVALSAPSHKIDQDVAEERNHMPTVHA